MPAHYVCADDAIRCVALLFLQLAGREFHSSLTLEEKEEQLKQAFAKKSVLLVSAMHALSLFFLRR